MNALKQGSPNFFDRRPHELLHNCSRLGQWTSYVMWLFQDILRFTK